MTNLSISNQSTFNLKPYQFASETEADVSYQLISWFAVTESAAIGIFPLLSALEIARKERPEFFGEFFGSGFRHFRDEQQHANLWCHALLQFVEHYPEVVKRVKITDWRIKIMLGSIGKQHSVVDFGIDCLAFELIMQAFYDVAQPRLHYPAFAPIFQRITRDEVEHTAYDQGYFANLLKNMSRRQRMFKIARFWRNLTGVLITMKPVFEAINRLQPLPAAEFSERLTYYLSQTDLPGNPRLTKMILGFGWHGLT